MDFLIIGLLLLPLALGTGSLFAWGIVGLCLCAPIAALVLGPVLRPRR